mmetsp:Transcript_29820/g.62817  ORF Transcript_29820/g.62817 Transcript_29820/m.62817 type:complete len:519 (+) Transcript_29820:232-1788(+)|eukprot:CAMPEP_0183732754 /NCGR_PEP_ID=MMETSP0737-20130205/39276_1 /TAXON_ID=385413 /ORGANISM="Thalassiosira miniscula, Strain CCMP1093" /LENGTH=518 /DNA_ID=CAMNT_0025965851 /DNA_START=103 /DNA_END=1659 /DNA_ORIENTATION=+
MGDNQQGEQLKGIVKPHAHDVLSGRGNFVNHHSGNENFRKLVKHHKKAYVACPKAQKAIYSKIIYDEIRAMSPPGRFLKQDPKTKLWSDIGEKKALDKTRQALREGAPELLKEMEAGLDVGGDVGGGNGGDDFVSPLQRMQRDGHPLASSLLGGMSLSSFSLGSNQNNNGGSFTSQPPIPSQVGVNEMFAAQGPGSILAAAAQLQAQQQHQQQQLKQQQPQSQLEAQLQLLKQMQMNTQQANLTAQQGLGGMGSMGQNSANFSAMVAAAQAQAQAQANGNNLGMGNNEMTALLAAIHNSASTMNNPAGMANPAAAMYQQQLAQVAMLNQSDSTLMTGNHLNAANLNLNNINNSMNNDTGNNNQNAFQQQQQQQTQQPIQESYQQEHSFNVSVPLKSPSDAKLESSAGNFNSNNRRSGANRSGGGLNSSFSRAQRIGLKNSFTSQRRPNRHMDMTNQLKSSLMSIESLTLDDIDSADFNSANVEGVFDDESSKRGGSKIHGKGPHDMSEVSELEFEEKA